MLDFQKLHITFDPARGGGGSRRNVSDGAPCEWRARNRKPSVYGVKYKHLLRFF